MKMVRMSLMAALIVGIGVGHSAKADESIGSQLSDYAQAQLELARVQFAILCNKRDAAQEYLSRKYSDLQGEIQRLADSARVEIGDKKLKIQQKLNQKRLEAAQVTIKKLEKEELSIKEITQQQRILSDLENPGIKKQREDAARAVLAQKRAVRQFKTKLVGKTMLAGFVGYQLWDLSTWAGMTDLRAMSGNIRNGAYGTALNDGWNAVKKITRNGLGKAAVSAAALYAMVKW